MAKLRKKEVQVSLKLYCGTAVLLCVVLAVRKRTEMPLLA